MLHFFASYNAALEMLSPSHQRWNLTRDEVHTGSAGFLTADHLVYALQCGQTNFTAPD